MEDLEQLITRAQKGDKNAFAQIYQLFYKRIYRYCCLHLNSTDLAKDVCQETFIKAWRHLPTFTQGKGSSFQAFLFKIAQNTIIDLSRKKKELPLVGDGEIEVTDNLDEDFDRQDSVKRVRKALANLHEDEKQIITLRFFEELSFSEIAKIIGIREGALRVKTHRLLKKMKDLLKEKKWKTN